MKLYGMLILTCIFFLQLQAANIKIASSQPHRKDCYTQGLFFLNNTHLFESCGLYNESFFHISKYTSNPFVLEQTYESKIPWKSDIFLEGATLFKDYIYLLTWQEHVVYKLDPENFTLIKTLNWGSQGWGLTQNGTHMFVSDGSDIIYLVDQEFKVLQKKHILTLNGRKAYNLNQLEYVNGSIYANIYYDRFIHKIQYQSGKVTQQYDGLDLIRNQKTLNNIKNDEVFNGIAFNQFTQKFIVTGKKWSTILEVTF